MTLLIPNAYAAKTARALNSSQKDPVSVHAMHEIEKLITKL
jgi:hypothetical protein